MRRPRMRIGTIIEEDTESRQVIETMVQREMIMKMAERHHLYCRFSLPRIWVCPSEVKEFTMSSCLLLQMRYQFTS
jgi:hypothetical protein